MQKAKLKGPTPIQTQLVLQFAQDLCREQSIYGEPHPPNTKEDGMFVLHPPIHASSL